MRHRVLVIAGAAVAVAYVAGTGALAFAQWYSGPDSRPVITAADVLTGWATIPRHIAQYQIIQSWNLDDPQPTDQFATWDAICTGAAGLINVLIVVVIVTVFRRFRRRFLARNRARLVERGRSVTWTGSGPLG